MCTVFSVKSANCIEKSKKRELLNEALFFTFYTLVAFSSLLLLIINSTMHTMNPIAQNGPAVLIAFTMNAPEKMLGDLNFSPLTETVFSLISCAA